MAKRVCEVLLGVDVCKDWLDISDGRCVQRIENARPAIAKFLRSLNGPVRLAMEPTHRYHVMLLEEAHRAGHRVYLVDAFRLSRYRDAIGVRCKTDACDAHLLHRYLTAEGQRLCPWCPPPKAVQRLRDLLRVRSKLTVAKAMLGQSMGQVGELARTRASVLARLEGAMAVIDRKLARLVKTTGYRADTARCQAIPGIGPLNATALVAAYYRGRFASADAFVAYLGLDIRIRESGRYRGQCKLSKRGNPELRRLLFNAARSAAQTSRWRDYYQRLRDQGRSTTAAYVALSRKLARVTYALLRDQSQYRDTAIA